MEGNIKVTFWLNKTKKNSQNLVPVYLRICHNYAQFTKTTGISVRISDWDKKGMRVKGATAEVNTTNTQLDAIKVKVMQIVNHLTVLGKPFNINTVKKMLEGNNSNQITLMRV